MLREEEVEVDRPHEGVEEGVDWASLTHIPEYSIPEGEVIEL